MSAIPHTPPSRRLTPLAVDVALVAITFFATVAMLHSGRFEEAGREADALGVVLAALTALPLAARRRWPLVVFPAVWIPTLLLYALDYSLGPPIGSMVALYEVAASARLSRRQGLTAAVLVAAALLVFLVLSLVGPESFEPAEFFGGLLTWGGAWYVGDRVRLRRERVEARRERAEREAQLAAAEERTRIARDLHDSAGHAINVILVQAGAARLLQEKDPERSRQALETIESVARETIGDIDRMVRVLRGDAHTNGVEPSPGLSALDGLAERHRASGLDLTVEVNGTRRPLAPSVDGAGYRILQEALTNAAVHGAGSARVEVEYGPAALEITVTNPTRPEASTWPGGGHGIVGMQERAGLLGGFVAVDSAHGVFRVRARLPYAEGGG